MLAEYEMVSSSLELMQLDSLDIRHRKHCNAAQHLGEHTTHQAKNVVIVLYHRITLAYVC